jgi:hypothetical protein
LAFRPSLSRRSDPVLRLLRFFAAGNFAWLVYFDVLIRHLTLSLSPVEAERVFLSAFISSQKPVHHLWP